MKELNDDKNESFSEVHGISGLFTNVVVCFGESQSCDAKIDFEKK